MPPRATWTGHLKVSLVTFGVRLYNATSSAGRPTLNQLHKDTHARLRQKLYDPTTGEEASRDDIVKGYQFEKDRYVIIDAEDLERIRLESSKTIAVERFVEMGEIEDIYQDSVYYLAPDGPVSAEGFAVVRDAMRRSGRAAVGRLVLSGRERIVAIAPRGQGCTLTTLRHEDEVRSAEPYFETIPDQESQAGPDASGLKLAEQLIESMAGPFEPGEFPDRYQEALHGIIRAKIDGSEPVIAEEREVASTLNFMQALRASLGEEDTAGAGAGSSKKRSGGKRGGAKSSPKSSSKTGTKPSGEGDAPPRKRPPAKSVKKTARRRKQA